MNKIIDWVKESINDIRVLIQERNFKPFWRPILLIVIICGLIVYLNNVSAKKVSNIKTKIEAQRAELDNEKEYKSTKTKYQKLLANLPPSNQKNEWILLQLGAIINQLGLDKTLKYSKSGTGSYGVFEVSSAKINGLLTYSELGRLVETIENNPQFLRISNMNLSRSSSLGKISVQIEVYTAFLPETKSA